jgi:GT2 family glycosyltransferase
MDGDASIVAVAFNIDGSELPMWPEDWPEGEVSHFTGCGHLLRRSTFLELGGYREPFVHMCEEIDFGLRAVGAGFRILGLPAVVVSHRITLQARSNSRNWFLSKSNLTCTWWLNLSFIYAVLRTARTVAGIFRQRGEERQSLLKWLSGVLHGARLAWSLAR